MIIHLLTGFLGSGKTTAIQQACRTLQKNGMRVGVITNDQGIKLVDGFFFRNMGIPERQVGNGCFCCNYNILDTSIAALTATHQTNVIFAESVGSCTDIVATVMKPLLRYHTLFKVTLTTIVDTRLLHMLLKDPRRIFQEDVEYIYFKQLEEAEIIVLNKSDLADEVTLNEVLEFVRMNYAGKKVIIQNSLHENGIASWMDALTSHNENAILPSLVINYDKYAHGEAQMGFLDQQLVIRSEDGTAEEAAVYLIKIFVELIRESHSTIGHLKFLVNDKHKFSFTCTTAENIEEDFVIENATTCDLLVNARVQISPDELNMMMIEAINRTEQQTGITISDSSISFFKPGYPRPLHRIED